MPAAPSPWYPIESPLYLSHPGIQVFRAHVLFSRHHQDKTRFRVGWHQQKLPTCSLATPRLHYNRVFHGYENAELPFRAIVELSEVHGYSTELLRLSDAFAWYVFRTEWATNGAVYLLEFARRVSGLYVTGPRWHGEGVAFVAGSEDGMWYTLRAWAYAYG